MTTSPDDRPSMFDFAGGAPAFQALARAHHERCIADPVLEHPFSHGTHPQHVERLGSYWAEVFGGPPIYSTTCLDQSEMVGIHAGTGAEDSMGPRFVACFVHALDDAGLPDDSVFRQSMRAYIEWAVHDVMSYAPRDSVVPDDLSMPHWSWDGRQT